MNDELESRAIAERFRAIVDDDWEFKLQEYPLFATQVGDPRYDDRLGDVNEDSYRRRLTRARDHLSRLEELDGTLLDEPERTNFEIFERLKRDEIAELEFRGYLCPVTSRSGFHVAFADLPRRLRLDSVEGYEAYLARLESFGRYTEQHIEIMRRGMAEGFMPPSVALDGFEGPIASHVVGDATESVFFEPLERFAKRISRDEQQRLVARAKSAIEGVVVPAFRVLLDFMRDEYVPVARESIACSDFPNGRAFYEHRVRRYASLDVTPEDVHSVGLVEVERLRGEIDAVIRRADFDGTFAEFVAFLREDSRFYCESADELLREVAFILKRMDGKLPEFFKSLPRMPYGIERVPDYLAPKSPTAYYKLPSGDGRTAGYFMVNTYDLASRPRYEFEALSFHEAVPGHHLQIAIQQELENLPPFRRFQGFTAFVEGWALYAERLGLEAGFYQDPFSDFGRLSYEIWRACRLVVDTGIHAFGWSRRKAIDYMTEHTALTTHNIETEIDRYISWPGQALAYKMGELKLRELREFAERELGAGFDIRGFHETVIGGGAVPLTVLERHVREWVGAG